MVRKAEVEARLGTTDITVAEAVKDWLQFGLTRHADSTQEQLTTLANRHVIPRLGGRRLRELKASEVDSWLRTLAKTLSTDSLRRLHSILNRSLRRAMARDIVSRNVASMVDIPKGQPGRPSRSLTPEVIDGILTSTKRDPMHAYLVLGLLTGARTEELRALLWVNVHLEARQVNGIDIPHM